MKLALLKIAGLLGTMGGITAVGVYSSDRPDPATPKPDPAPEVVAQAALRQDEGPRQVGQMTQAKFLVTSRYMGSDGQSYDMAHVVNVIVFRDSSGAISSVMGKIPVVGDRAPIPILPYGGTLTLFAGLIVNVAPAP